MSKRDGIEVLSDITGISRDGIGSIWEQVKANVARLRSCERHDFSREYKRGGSVRYQCLRCRGTVDRLQKYWYEIGVLHGETEQRNKNGE